MNSTADYCDVSLNCRYTEDIRALDNSSAPWFRAKKKEELFFFYELPVSIDEMLKDLAEDADIDGEKLIPVTVGSLSDETKIPTEIEVTLQYYQVTLTEKKLIKSDVMFSGWIDPTNYPNSNHFNYTLKIIYMPMSNTELTIYFALNWYVYFIMYVIVG